MGTWRARAVVGLVLLVSSQIGMTCGSPPLEIAEPAPGANLAAASPLTIRIRYNSQAMPISADGTTAQLEVRLNGVRVPVAVSAIGSNQALLTVNPDALQPGLVQPGRSLLSVFVPSTNSAAALSGNDGFLVKHRVFHVQDADRDGLPDATDPAPGIADADNDGLLDSVEAHVGSGSLAGIPGTAGNGDALVAAVRPASIVPGRAVALIGAGFENIDQPAEVLFSGQPATALLRSSPTQLIVNSPSSLAAGNTSIDVLDVGGVPETVAAVHADGIPAVAKNLVLVSSIFAQQFFDGAGGLVSSRTENIPLFLNMLPFGTATRVLIDASKMDPAAQALVTPDLELILETQGGADATTRLVGTLSDSVLEDVDLLVLLISNVLAVYGPGELQAIENWIRTPGHRLVVVSSSLDGGSNFVANLVLQQVGATSHFDASFPLSSEQRADEYLTAVAGFFVDPPFTNNIDVLSYFLPTSIILGQGANEIARAGICLSNEIPTTVPGPDPLHPILVGCQDGETGQQLGVLATTYVASEQLPTTSPKLRILSVAPGTTLDGSVDATGDGFVELPPTGAITVKAALQNLPASTVVFSAGGKSATVQASAGTAMVQATLSGLAPGAFPLGLHVQAVGQGISAADTAVVAIAPQQVKVRFTVFADQDGTPAIDAGVLAAAQRQAGLELQALCAGAKHSLTGLPLPPLSSSLSFEGGATSEVVMVPAISTLVAFTADQSNVSQMAMNVARGRLPNGSPSTMVPDPSPGGAAGPVPIRVFVVNRFQRMNPVAGGSPLEVTQDSETGVSIFANAFFGSDDDAQDLVLAQARDGDLEGDSLQVDRPVASSLAHELVHVLGAVEDNADEVADIPNLPTQGSPSVMNSFPFFRSLEVGDPGSQVTLPDSCALVGGGIPNGQAGIDAICTRVLDGFSSCLGNGPFDFTEQTQ